MGIRIGEHKNNEKNKDERSAIANHAVIHNHNFDFKKATILDTEQFEFKRKFSEMLHIHFYDNTINRMEDTLYLKNIYKNIINKFKVPPL